MQVRLEPGKYIVAVSGGVDSMVLLDVIQGIPNLELLVAHFEHGIRDDSDSDRKLVESAAKKYRLPFIYEHGNLGSGVGESQAREARYVFLRRVMAETGADAILTAHHRDDLIETAILNVLRGTGRKGLSSLQSTSEIIRPFLNYSKQEILAYARDKQLAWHEDSTNQNDQYLRNYIRHHIVPRLGESGRARLLEHITKAGQLNPDIDTLLIEGLHEQLQDGLLNRRWFVSLPYDVSCEAMAAWLRARGIRDFDRRLIERLVVAAKVAMPGKVIDINAEYWLKVHKDTLSLSFRTTS